MFGSSSPKPQPFIPPPPYQNAPAYQNAPPFVGYDPMLFEKMNEQLPQIQTGRQILANAPMSAAERSALNGGWLDLGQAPTDSQNMNRAENYYLQTQGLPQMAQDQSNLYANGQGGSSYAGAYLGQEQAMNNLNAFNAGLNQQETDYQNVLNARNALYSQPIALQAQQNANNVSRGLGIAGLDLNQGLANSQYNLGNTEALNSYNLANNQGLNNYNLQGASGHNNYNASIFGSQSSAAAQRNSAGLGFMGGIASDIIGGGTSLINGSSYSTPGGGSASGIRSLF